MKLSREEELFLARWMYDELNYQSAQGPAKKLQVEHHAVPADLAEIVAAAIPDFADQERTAQNFPPPEQVIWPWRERELEMRLAEARAIRAEHSAT